MGKYVIYTRVSTREQGDSGISLEEQLEQCRRYVQRQDGIILSEHYDIKSGSSRKRAGLDAALASATENEATLVFAKLDRLARDAEYAMRIRNSGIPLYFLDSPNISTLEFGIRAVVAQEERELGRKRTKDALENRKRKIAEDGGFTSKSGRTCTKLGNPDPSYALELGREVSARNRRMARENDPTWQQARKLAEENRRRGDSLTEIADTLNTVGIKTRTGGEWYAASVGRLLKYPLKS